MTINNAGSCRDAADFLINRTKSQEIALSSAKAQPLPNLGEMKRTNLSRS